MATNETDLKSRIAELEAQLVAVRKGAQTVLDTFRRDEDQGFRSRDRQFAIEILEKALQEPEAR